MKIGTHSQKVLDTLILYSGFAGALTLKKKMAGRAKPVAAWPLNPENGYQTVSDSLTNSVLNVTARGGVLKYEATEHANSRHDFYHHDQFWCV